MFVLLSHTVCSATHLPCTLNEFEEVFEAICGGCGESTKMFVSTVNKHIATVYIVCYIMRKRSSSYHRYELEMKAKIGQYAVENGNKVTVTKFSGDLGFDLHASTVRSFCNLYKTQMLSLNLRERNMHDLPLFQRKWRILWRSTFISLDLMGVSSTNCPD